MQINEEDLRAWAHRSLRDGSPLMQALAGQIENFGNISLIAPRNLQGRFASDQSQGITRRDKAECISELLQHALPPLAGWVAVQDDRTRLDDPEIHTEGNFDSEMLIRFVPLPDTSGSAFTLLETGASGHPTNALVLSRAADSIASARGLRLSDESREVLRAATVAILVSVWDDEALIYLANSKADLSLGD